MYFFRSSSDRAVLCAVRLGSASPYVRLRVRGVAVTYSVCVSGRGIDSFLGFEYGGVITLTSRVFRILLPILPSSLRFLSSVLWLRWPAVGLR